MAPPSPTLLLTKQALRLGPLELLSPCLVWLFFGEEVSDYDHAEEDQTMDYLLVALGAAIGSFCRYKIGAWVQGLAGDPNFPVGTFLVNITGAFLIGLAFGINQRAYLFSGAWSFLAVGAFGGYTTFSTFTLETLDLFTKGNYRGVLLNLLSGPVGLIAVALGVVFVEGLHGLGFAT